MRSFPSSHQKKLQKEKKKEIRKHMFCVIYSQEKACALLFTMIHICKSPNATKIRYVCNTKENKRDNGVFLCIVAKII